MRSFCPLRMPEIKNAGACTGSGIFYSDLRQISFQIRDPDAESGLTVFHPLKLYTYIAFIACAFKDGKTLLYRHRAVTYHRSAEIVGAAGLKESLAGILPVAALYYKILGMYIECVRSGFSA